MSASFEFYKLNKNLERELQEAFKKDIEWQNQINRGDYTRANELEFELKKFLKSNCEILEFSTSSSFSHEIREDLIYEKELDLEDTYCFYLLFNSPSNCKVLERTEIYQDKWNDYFDGVSLLLFSVN